MRRRRFLIDRLTGAADGQSLFRFAGPAEGVPAPGQLSLGLRPGSGEVLRVALYPRSVAPSGFQAVVPSDCGWSVGDEVDLAGPIGNPFRPPQRSRHWLLASFDRPPDRLLPLVSQGLAGGAEIALVCSLPPGDLPAAVEVNPPWGDVVRWADFVALDLGRQRQVGKTGEGLADAGSLRGVVQALVTPSMPCGLGVCGACAIATRRGWALACREGTVWDVRDLPT